MLSISTPAWTEKYRPVRFSEIRGHRRIKKLFESAATKGCEYVPPLILYGPPGTGKTEVAKIMGQIFSKIGILEKGTFKKVTRSDLVAGYLGQTAIKTTDVIK